MGGLKRIGLVLILLVVMLMLSITIHVIYLFTSLSDYQQQRSAYDILNAQYISAIADGDRELAAEIKPHRTYQMGVKTRAETKFEEKRNKAILYLSLTTINFAVMGFSFWGIAALMARLPQKQPERQKHEPYPFGYNLTEECDDEPEGKWQ